MVSYSESIEQRSALIFQMYGELQSTYNPSLRDKISHEHNPHSQSLRQIIAVKQEEPDDDDNDDIFVKDCGQDSIPDRGKRVGETDFSTLDRQIAIAPAKYLVPKMPMPFFSALKFPGQEFCRPTTLSNDNKCDANAATLLQIQRHSAYPEAFDLNHLKNSFYCNELGPHGKNATMTGRNWRGKNKKKNK